MGDPIQIAEPIASLFPLIPLEPHGKRPVLNSWQDPAARDTFDIMSHKGNIGGVIGDDHFVLDIDPRNGGEESYNKFVADFPAFPMFYTASVVTAGGGAHFYLTLPRDHGRKITKSLEQYPGLDFLSGNRYVVLPGSVNGKGSWAWHKGPVLDPPVLLQDILEGLFPDAAEPQELPPADGLWGLLSPEDMAALLNLLDVTDYAEHDKWFELMAICHHATGGDGKEVFLEWSSYDPTYSGDYEQSAYRWDTLTDAGPGARPLTARSLTRCFKQPPAWLMAKLNHKDASTLFQPLPTTPGSPQAPLVDAVAEAEKALTDYHGRIKMENNPRELTKNLWPVIIQDSRLDEVDVEELGREIAKKAGTTLATMKRLAKVVATKADKEPQAGEINEEELHLSVARGVIARLGGEENLVYQAGDFWWYNGKHWEMKENASTQHLINRVTQEMGGAGFLTGPFISSTNTVLQTYLEPKAVGYWNPEDKEVRINTQEGMLELDALGQWQIIPHNKKHRMNYCLPITPVETPTPHFDKYMQDAVNGDEGTIRTLLAALVYTATSKKQWWKRCFFLHGESDTGKTVFLELLEAFIGNERRESLSMKDLGKEYTLCNLRGKLLNSSGELDSSRIDVEIFKKLISGDSITTNRKHQGHVQFSNNAIFWFAGNNWPNLRDESNASLNRITLIEFPNVRESQDQDSLLIEKLKAELPGIFYKALRIFADEYVKDKGFSIRETPAASQQAFDEFRARAQPILLWKEEHVAVTMDENDFCLGATLYQDYKQWAVNSGHYTMNESSFRLKLPKLLKVEKGRAPGRNGQRGYVGVKIRSIF